MLRQQLDHAAHVVGADLAPLQDRGSGEHEQPAQLVLHQVARQVIARHLVDVAHEVGERAFGLDIEHAGDIAEPVVQVDDDDGVIVLLGQRDGEVR